ncbi:MAG: hypothetical protein RBT38_13700 [Bacteroidales bacterium]|jgi:hypothetical protein|nr:hypothetical protein [Bacteroidales bacterium]
MPDKDSVAVIDSETQDEVHDESDDPDAALPDSDNSVPDTAVNDDEFIDDCDVKLIDAKFPYYDKDSNITFCRPGCDTPTEKDPQCMSNLWREQNHNLCHQHPEYDCCGYPCVLETLNPMTKEETDKELVFEGEILVPMHKCDLFLSVWNHDGTHGVVKSWNMSEGKVGFYLYTTKLTAQDWPVQSKHVTYDIATKKYNFIVPSRGQEQAYFKGNRVGLVSDKRNLDLNNSYIFLAYIKDDGFKTLAYNKKVHRIAYEPAMNDKWAFVNLQETETSPYKMMYAKVGDPSSNSTADSWKWTVLGEGTLRYSELGGDYLGIYDEQKNGYICNLSKTPKSFTDCLKINRDGEKLSIVVFNKSNSNEFIYNSNGKGIVLAKLNQNKFEYIDLVTDFTEETEENAYTLSPYSFNGNIVVYAEITYKDDDSGSRICYYRIDKKKKYCMKKMDKDESYSDGTTQFRYGFSEFEGKWFLYQKLNSTPLILRDMECYCKEEGVCPFEE